MRWQLIYILAVIFLSACVGLAAWYYPIGTSNKSRDLPGASGRPENPLSALPPAREATHTPSPELPAGVEINFEDVTAAAGIQFQHFDGRTPMEYIMDSTGSGVAWLDYDQDGLLDLFLVQGGSFEGNQPESLPACKLYKNLGHGRFRDVTAETGLGHVGCGQGVAVGDIDNDGYPDLFLTCYGKPNVLYHNVADGKGGRRFEDITRSAGLADHPDWRERPNYSTSAAFFDYDNDGYLDLFVCSYVKVDMANYPYCSNSRNTRRGACPPARFDGTHCVLYRNTGKGAFTDVSHEAGIDQPNAKALGVIALDLDDDGKPDIFVANDAVPNFLFRNLGNGKFESIGPVSGCAVNLAGNPQAYMGVDADDLTGSGRPDIFSTAFSHETNTLFRNEGHCQFLDITHITGLGPPSWYMVGFGTCFFDADLDGNLDVFVTNGHVSRHIDDEGDPNVTFREKALLFRGNGKGRFQDISEMAGDYFRTPHAGRAVAYADFDNDGSMDLALNNTGEAAVLLHNVSKTPNHWIRLELRGVKSNRDAVGAKVTVSVGGRQLVRHRKGGGGYCSANDPRLLVGLGSLQKVDKIEIRWPSGLVQTVGPLEADRGYLVVEGQSKVQQRP